jgi:hypothetical protein
MIEKLQAHQPYKVLSTPGSTQISGVDNLKYARRGRRPSCRRASPYVALRSALLGSKRFAQGWVADDVQHRDRGRDVAYRSEHPTNLRRAVRLC